MASLRYIHEKLSDALYLITVHEGDACTRLARALPKLILSPDSFPAEVREDFKWVMSILEKGSKTSNPNVLPSKIRGIQNRTARKVIEKLVYINYIVAESIHNKS